MRSSKLQVYKGPAGFSWCELFSFVIVPWSAFVGVLLLFALVYHSAQMLVWTVIGVMVSFCVIGAFHSINTRQPGTVPFQLYLGGLIVFATCVAVPVGLSTFELYFGTYWNAERGAVHKNVLPQEAAAGYKDSSMLLFAENVRVDSSRSVGFKKDGTTYCVAPILDEMNTDEVQFWAAGPDCCGQRGAFACDDSFAIQARSGVVIRYNTAPYLEAVKLAAATFGIASAEEPLFVRWVVSPDSLQESFWISGVGMVVVASSVYLVLSTLAIVILQNALKAASKTG